MSAVTHPNNIHPSAVVSSKARIGSGCFIGPYSIIGDEVELEDGVRLESHCSVSAEAPEPRNANLTQVPRPVEGPPGRDECHASPSLGMTSGERE